MRLHIARLLLIVAAPCGFAEDTSQWSGVQLLHKGDRVGVIQANQKRVEGRFESATDASITIQADQPVTLEKGEVVRVYRPAKHSRVFGAVVGGAIGVAAGAVVDGTFGRLFRNEGHGPPRGVITGVGAGAGVGIGVALTGRYRTVYQRPK